MPRVRSDRLSSGDVRTIYLDNAATSHPKAPTVERALIEHLSQIANPGRSGHRLAINTERMIDTARTRLARLLAVDDPRRVVFTSGGTDALHLAIDGVLRATTSRGERPRVIGTMLDHNAVRRPLEEEHAADRIDLHRLSCSSSGVLDPDELKQRLDEMIRAQQPPHLVCLIHASNVAGIVQPIESLVSLVRAMAPEAVVVLDAAQTVGVRAINVSKLDVDLMAFPAHKGLLGPTGVGALIVGPRLVPDPGTIDSAAVGMLPVRAGGTGGDSTSPRMPRRLPSYLEAGTPNTLGLAGLAASLAWLMEYTVERVASHDAALMQRLLDGLSSISGVRVLGQQGGVDRVGVVSFVVDGWRPEELAGALDVSFGIALRSGLHCAPTAHEALGTAPDGAIRASVGPFNTEEDIDVLLNALRELTASGSA